jgi:hypothetical protein
MHSDSAVVAWSTAAAVESTGVGYHDPSWRPAL